MFRLMVVFFSRFLPCVLSVWTITDGCNYFFQLFCLFLLPSLMVFSFFLVLVLLTVYFFSLGQGVQVLFPIFFVDYLTRWLLLSLGK